MIKAIETQYHGYRFRSRLEARWAVFFDSLGLLWEYEHEGFDLGRIGWYLPDFWLPDLECWVEIKPTVEEAESGRDRCEELGCQTDNAVVMCIGTPGQHRLWAFRMSCCCEFEDDSLLMTLLVSRDWDKNACWTMHDPTLKGKHLQPCFSTSDRSQVVDLTSAFETWGMKDPDECDARHGAIDRACESARWFREGDEWPRYCWCPRI